MEYLPLVTLNKYYTEVEVKDYIDCANTKDLETYLTNCMVVIFTNECISIDQRMNLNKLAEKVALEIQNRNNNYSTAYQLLMGWIE